MKIRKLHQEAEVLIKELNENHRTEKYSVFLCLSHTHTNLLHGHSSPVEMIEDRMSELKNKSVEFIQEFMQSEKQK